MGYAHVWMRIEFATNAFLGLIISIEYVTDVQCLVIPAYPTLIAQHVLEDMECLRTCV